MAWEISNKLPKLFFFFSFWCPSMFMFLHSKLRNQLLCVPRCSCLTITYLIGNKSRFVIWVSMLHNYVFWAKQNTLCNSWMILTQGWSWEAIPKPFAMIHCNKKIVWFKFKLWRYLDHSVIIEGLNFDNEDLDLKSRLKPWKMP